MVDALVDALGDDLGEALPGAADDQVPAEPDVEREERAHVVRTQHPVAGDAGQLIRHQEILRYRDVLEVYLCNTRSCYNNWSPAGPLGVRPVGVKGR